MKKPILIALCLLFACYAFYQITQRTFAHIVGITTKIPDDLQSFENYKARLNFHLNRMDEPNYSFKELKQDRMEELQFEVKYAEVVLKMLKELDKYRQLGG